MKKEIKTTEKSLTNKAIDIKGKKYVLVADRIVYFNEEYKNGMIQTSILSGEDSERIIIKALVYPDADKLGRYFTGHSQAKWGDGFINKTSAVENAETSAIGRALAMMGIGVIDSVSSVDEIKKAEQSGNQEVDKFAVAKNIINSCKDQTKLDEFVVKISTSKNFTDKQKEYLTSLIKETIVKLNEPTIQV